MYDYFFMSVWEFGSAGLPLTGGVLSFAMDGSVPAVPLDAPEDAPPEELLLLEPSVVLAGAVCLDVPSGCAAAPLSALGAPALGAAV